MLVAQLSGARCRQCHATRIVRHQGKRWQSPRCLSPSVVHQKCSRTGPSRPAGRFRVREHRHASSCEGIRKASWGGKGRARLAAFNANAPPSLTLNAVGPRCNPIRPPEEWVTYRIRKRRGKVAASRGTYPGFPLGGFGNGCGIPRPPCPPGAGGGSGSGVAGSTLRPSLSPAGWPAATAP